MNKILISVGLAFALAGSGLLPAQAQTPAALTGQVTSGEEGPMEGVLISAKKAGSTITITVVSDAQGNYSFPAAKLEPGQYSLRIRAVGYDLDRPASVDVAAQQPAKYDLKLRKTEDLAAQLSNARMACKLPRHRPAEERDAGLRGLPHARAGGALEPQARRFHPRHAAAHAGLREPEHSGRSAASARRAPDGRARGPARAGLSRHGRLSRRRQSELGPAMELRAQDAAAPERPQHPRGHHRI